MIGSLAPQGINVAVMIRRREIEDENGRRVVRRFIDQICFFNRKDGENKTIMIVDDGKLLSASLPEDIMIKMNRAGIKNPFSYNGEVKNMDEVISKSLSGIGIKKGA